ncbi:MAG: response regulator transcription factor [Bacteroidales bacterium]|nr:response regulator transcription factor [Bacteroidales bacterium]
MNVLIVEDEIAAARRLAKMMAAIEPTSQILSITDSISSTVEWLKNNNEPELILMDIHLADGSSFKIFDQVKIRCPIIFTTAYDQYAIQAFKVNSIDYLLKPIKEDELANSLKKYKEQRTEKSSSDLEKFLFALRKPEQDYQLRFVVQFADKLKSIEVNAIAYFIALEKSVFLVTEDGHRYAIDYTLEKLDEVLNPKIFYRINRKFIVNFSAIKGMFTYSKSRVKIELLPNPETEVIVSSERTSGFKEWLNQ